MNEKKLKNIIISLSIVIAALIIVIVVLIINLLNKPTNIDIDYKTYLKDRTLISLYSNPNKQDEILRDPTVFRNYDEFLKYFPEGQISKELFEYSNFAIVPLMYDDCGEYNLVPTGYKIDGDTITLTVYYDRACGVCAPKYDYYAIELEKNNIDYKIKINSIPRNKVTCDPMVAYKPIIYLYPTKKMNINVKLGYENKLIVSYPKYNNGWNVTALPDGTLYDEKNEYYALYWEGKDFYNEMTEEGFVVKKDDTIEFLEEKLSYLGLNDRERNEFIMYWLPKLEASDLNYIRFLEKESIDNYMPLEITPTPDNIIRVYMVYKPLEKDIKIQEQELKKPSRTGYTVVEWGGSKID